VEEKPPQQKPIGTVIREKNEQFVYTDCVLTGNDSPRASSGYKKSVMIRVYI
jgi:hypothetical protein